MTDVDLSGRALGEFVLREQIGEGGYGVVYRSDQPALNRQVVVKVLRKQDPIARERFLREAQLASRLEHPYAAHVHAFGAEPDGLLWIAMELVPGVTLKDWLETRGPIPLEQFVPFFECVAEVVQAAHDRGIVHRDLKPSNIMVIDRGDRLFPKLLDFGIAKVADEVVGWLEDVVREGSGDPRRGDTPTVSASGEPATGDPTRTASEPLVATRGAIPATADPGAHMLAEQWLTRTGVGMGSRAYMSPEQWRDAARVGPATDIYSLGIVTYQALTGRVPFGIEDVRGYLGQARRPDVPPLGPGFSPEVNQVIWRALAEDPRDRQHSALTLAAELRAALRAHPGEQLRSLAQVWDAQARPAALLLKGGELLRAQAETTGELERTFVAASRRHVARRAHLRRFVIVAALAGAAFWYRASVKAELAEQQVRAAQQLADAVTTRSELEQGRAALLHGEPEAQRHLAEAYKRDPAPTTAFMLARAMQPRLSELARLPSTHGRMWWATFSPDGSQIATADDRAAQIWDGKTYRLLYTLPHGCEIYQAIYSADGRRLVTVAKTMVRTWDARSGALLREFKSTRGQAPSDFFRAAVSPDGRFVAAMDIGGFLATVWDMERSVLVAELNNQNGNSPSLAFSTDGWLATTGGEEARIFDVSGWTQIQSIRGSIRSLAFDAKNRLVTGSSTGEVALWSIPRHVRLRQLRPFGESVNTVAFSPDGQLIAAGSRDGTIQVWQADSGVLQSQLNPRHAGIVGVEFTTNTALLLAANSDGTVMVVDAAQGLPLAVLDGPSNALRTAHFAPDGARIVGASFDGTARVWQAASPYRQWATAPTGNACNVGLSSRPDGRFIAIGCVNFSTRVWDTVHDQLLAELPRSTPIDEYDIISASPAVSAAGDLAAIAHGASVEVYALPGGRLVRTIEHSAAVSAIAFADSGTGAALVSGAIDGSVHVVREDGSMHALRASGVVEAAALLTGDRVLVADSERNFRMFAADGTILAALKLPVRLMSLRRENARVVALANCIADATSPLLIDLEQPRIDARLEGHVGCVLSARWVSRGRIVTTGADGTARLWDGLTGRLLQTYSGGSRFLGDAVLMSGIVVGGDAEGLLRFWDAITGAKLWTLQVHKSAVIGVHLEGTDIVTRGFDGEVSRWRLPQPDAVIDACNHHTLCSVAP